MPVTVSTGSSISTWVRNCEKLSLGEEEREHLDSFIDQLYTDLDTGEHCDQGNQQFSCNALQQFSVWLSGCFCGYKRKNLIRLDNFLLPMQCTGNLGCFPRWKRAAIVRCYPAFFLLFFLYAVFLCFHTTGYESYPFTTDGYGIFNVRTNLVAWRTLEGWSGTNKCAQELTLRDRKAVPQPAPPGDLTQGLRIWILTH